MLGSPILDVAIGMAFLYLLLSLIASAVQEIFASIIQARAANLQRGLRSLFSGDCLFSHEPLVKLLYEHGLIRGLYQDPDRDYGPHAEEPARAKKRRQIWGGARLILRRLFGMQPPGIPSDVDDLLLPAYIPARTFALALRDLLNEPKPFGWDSLKNIEENLTALRTTYKDNKAVEALLALVVDAAGDPARLQSNLENWYNDAMDRISGWYKRYVQNVLLLIGLVLAISFNVDSVRVARTLWLDKDARAGLASAANEYLSKHSEPPKAASVPGSTAGAEIDVKGLGTNLQNTVNAYNEVGKSSLLPVGWKRTPEAYWSTYRERRYHGVPEILLAVLGWMITAAALSFGAPFWFDTLNKFMVVRSTVKPQEKSRNEGSKD